MKLEQQQIAIATACGWGILEHDLFPHESPFKWIVLGPSFKPSRAFVMADERVASYLPDFLNDFHAIRAAIASLKDKKARWPTHSTDEPALHVFSWHLIDLLGLDEYEPDVIKLVLADAEKLCEAFLKTLNLWVD